MRGPPFIAFLLVVATVAATALAIGIAAWEYAKPPATTGPERLLTFTSDGRFATFSVASAFESVRSLRTVTTNIASTGAYILNITAIIDRVGDLRVMQLYSDDTAVSSAAADPTINASITAFLNATELPALPADHPAHAWAWPNNANYRVACYTFDPVSATLTLRPAGPMAADALQLTGPVPFFTHSSGYELTSFFWAWHTAS